MDENAKSDLDALDKPTKERVKKKLHWLAENFDTITPIPLTGEFRGLYKLRVGDWRVFYAIDWEEQFIVVGYIDHRRDAYS